MVVNFFEASANFELEPEKAIEYFKGKGLKQSYNWHEMINQDHDLSFTVAKMMDDDLLITIRNELDKALLSGTTFEDFKKTLIPTLQKKGWWGKKDIIDAATGHVTQVQLGSASRLETIFRTNMQSSYAAGQWGAIQEAKGHSPFLMYDAVDDGRTREEHAQFDGLVLPVDDPFWNSHYPPNGWLCRCGVIQMDAEEAADEGLNIGKTPKVKQRKWTNPTTGKTNLIPDGVDPGFVHNSGKSQLSKLEALQTEKHDKLAKNDAVAAQQAKKGAKATKAKAVRTKQQKSAARDLQLMTNSQAKVVITDYIGEYGARLPIPNTGKQVQLQAFDNLTDNHKRAIAIYTGNAYDDINQALYKQKTTKEQQAFINLLSEALKNSKVTPGHSTRAMFLMGEQLEDWVKGHEHAMQSDGLVSYRGFVSSTKNRVAKFKGNIYLHITGKNGVRVDVISQNAGDENEILFNKNTQFYVTKVDKTSKSVKIWLIEAVGIKGKETTEFSE